MNPWFPNIFSTAATVDVSRVGFDEIKMYIKNQPDSSCILINTLPEHLQQCLINNTTHVQVEVQTINQCMEEQNWNIRIYIYGMNHKDLTVERKQKQLREFGFRNVHVYLGGLFEWLLLQDVYGKTEFPTTFIQTDILQYKP